MSSTIQFFSKLTFVYWSMDGFLQVLWRGLGTSAIALNLGVLLGIGAVLNVINVWQFRKRTYLRLRDSQPMPLSQSGIVHVSHPEPLAI
jgi:hypothetical protein